MTWNEFEAYARQYIKRDGIDQLLFYMEECKFENQPASAGHHGAYAGGLMDHSINVHKRLVRELNEEYGRDWPYSEESVAIVGLFHDLCKLDDYITNEDGTFSYNPHALRLGHGEKSLYMLQRFITIYSEEALAIRWHMGGWDYAAKGGDPNYQYASNDALTVLLHFADMKASRFDEK